MTINPPDAVVAARSFPRRWRELFAAAAGDGEDGDLLERSGAVELADSAASSLLDTADRLRGGRTATAEDADVLDRIEHVATDLAHAIQAVPLDEWGDGHLDTLSDGIDRAASLLRQAERAIEQARHHHSA